MTSKQQAREAVVNGDAWGYFSTPSNFSFHFEKLALEKKFAQNETFEGSRIHLTMDYSSVYHSGSPDVYQSINFI